MLSGIDVTTAIAGVLAFFIMKDILLFETPYEDTIVQWIDEPLYHFAWCVLLIASFWTNHTITMMIALYYIVSTFDIMMLQQSPITSSPENKT